MMYLKSQVSKELVLLGQYQNRIALALPVQYRHADLHLKIYFPAILVCIGSMEL